MTTAIQNAIKIVNIVFWSKRVQFLFNLLEVIQIFYQLNQNSDNLINHRNSYGDTIKEQLFFLKYICNF